MLRSILVTVVNILNRCHVSGDEAKQYGDAIELLKNIIDVLDVPEGKEENHADQNEQG